MTSREALEKLYREYNCSREECGDCNDLKNGGVCKFNKYHEKLRHDLDHLEKLKKIIKENFDYNDNRVFFIYNSPVMEDEIKEILVNEK